MMNRIVLAVILVCWAVGLSAQQQQHEQTNAGTDFWVTDVVAGYDSEYSVSYFEQSLFAPDDYADTAVILIVGNDHCSGYAENPNTGWHHNFIVEPSHVTEVKVPEDQIMCYVTHDIQSKGIHIHTECETYVYMVTRQKRAYNGFQNTPQKFQVPPLPTGLTDASLPMAIGVYTTENPCCYNTASTVVVSEGVISEMLSSSYLLVAHENGTEVFVAGHYEASRPLSADATNSISWVPEAVHNLQQGEVLVIPMLCTEQGMNCMMPTPEEMSVEIHTNCKKVSIFQHRTQNPRWFFPTPLESVAPFHPNLLGNDFLVLDGVGYAYIGELQSVFHSGDNEDVPLFSQWMNDQVIMCHCPPFSYTMNWLASYAGSPRFIYNNHSLFPTEVQLYPASYWYEGHESFCIISSGSQLPYADKSVKASLFPILPTDNISLVCLSITTTDQGRYTTFVNGQLLPDSVFIIDDSLIGRYYITSIYYAENIPEVIRVENSNGFSAYLQEYNPCSTEEHPQPVTVTSTNSGCTYELPSIRPNIGTGVSTFCANDTLRVYAEGNCENYPITWTIEDSTFTSIDNDTLLFPLSFVDTLHFTMIVEKYCPDTLIDTMYVVLHPHITLPADTIICRGASITAQSDMFGFWQWSDGTASATFTPQEEGDYTVTVVNDCGSDSATIHVRFYDDPLYVDFGNDTLLCELATLLLDATQQHPASYLWQDASTNTTYTVISDGRYWVVVTDGCASTSDTIDVTYFQDLQISLGPDTTVCSSKPYLLDVTTPYCHYLWHDGTTAPTHWVDVPGTYSVHVYNVCTEANASVTVEVEECEEAVHVPNAFTPDGDGQNEVFLPVFNHPERLESYSMQVYDRWGRLLFGTENLHQGWDGRGCPTGTYVWRMEYKAAGEKLQLLTGSVTVVR